LFVLNTLILTLTTPIHIHTYVQSQTARARFSTKSTAEFIAALSPCILTSNPAPPEDPAFQRRIIPIHYSKDDEPGVEEKEIFNMHGSYISFKEDKEQKTLLFTDRNLLTTLAEFDRPDCYPFVKWPGGKRQLIKPLDRMIPMEFNKYIEPFVGGGAMFFHMVSRRNLASAAYLSNINTELITAYNFIKNNVEELIELLRSHQSKYRSTKYHDDSRHRVCSRHFDEVRMETSLVNDIQIAGRLIMLNKTCYNGLYRVSQRKGKFNALEGKRKGNPKICDANNLRNIGIALNHTNASIKVTDYKSALIEAKEGDFIYLDPRYLDKYTGYTPDGFNEKDHIELSKIFIRLHDGKCKLLLSNSDDPLIRQLYSKFHVQEINASRTINCKASGRGKDKAYWNEGVIWGSQQT
jgi:DNA adenine methylase